MLTGAVTFIFLILSRYWCYIKYIICTLNHVILQHSPIPVFIIAVGVFAICCDNICNANVRFDKIFVIGSNKLYDLIGRTERGNDWTWDTCEEERLGDFTWTSQWIWSSCKALHANRSPFLVENDESDLLCLFESVDELITCTTDDSYEETINYIEDECQLLI